ncbi:hypothetical protein ABPG74_007754 [Tetrahymena malaccensis]
MSIKQVYNQTKIKIQSISIFSKKLFVIICRQNFKSNSIINQIQEKNKQLILENSMGCCKSNHIVSDEKRQSNIQNEYQDKKEMDQKQPKKYKLQQSKQDNQKSQNNLNCVLYQENNDESKSNHENDGNILNLDCVEIQQIYKKNSKAQIGQSSVQQFKYKKNGKNCSFEFVEVNNILEEIKNQSQNNLRINPLDT